MGVGVIGFEVMPGGACSSLATAGLRVGARGGRARSRTKFGMTTAAEGD